MAELSRRGVNAIDVDVEIDVDVTGDSIDVTSHSIDVDELTLERSMSCAVAMSPWCHEFALTRP